MRICTSSQTVEPSDHIETLVWIGDHESVGFHEAYRHCSQHAAQIAVRRDLAEAISRPASRVGAIVLARSTRHPLLQEQTQQLNQIYPQANFLQLRGPLCEGDRDDHRWSGLCCSWHQWDEVLPRWLQPTTTSTTIGTATSVASVAVVAASMTAAEPLLDLVVDAGGAAIWCRRPEPLRVRGVQMVWWDDSVATPTDRDGWQRRLASCDADRSRCRHIWLVNGPRPQTRRDARAGGIERIVGKPFRIDSLSDVLAGVRPGAASRCSSRPPVIAA